MQNTKGHPRISQSAADASSSICDGYDEVDVDDLCEYMVSADTLLERIR